MEEWLIFFGSIAGMFLFVAAIIIFNDAKDKANRE